MTGTEKQLETVDEQPKPNVLTVTLGQIVQACSAKPGELSPIKTLHQSDELMAVTSYRLKEIVKQIDAKLEMYQESLKALQEKYAKKDEKGELVRDENGQLQFDEAQEPELNREFADLVNLEVQIEGKTITLFEIGSTKISAEKLEILSWLVIK